MRRIFQSVSIMLLCGVMMMPCTVEARERNNGGNNGGQQTSQTTRSRSNNSSNFSGNRNNGNTGNTRPGNSGLGTSVSNNRNNNSGSINNNRNNNSGSINNNRNNNSGSINNNRNNGGNINNNRNNGGNGGKINNNRPNNGGGHVANRPAGQPAVRQHMPAQRAYCRPTLPPATYRPYAAWPTFRSILGVALGTTIDLTLNALLNTGYTIASYGSNLVYLTDVPMLNLVWPDATLYYGTGGGLVGSEFVYSTPAYNVTRYNTTYSSLIRTYGQPYEVVQLSNGMRATWWGPSNQYIQLTFLGDYAVNGAMRYYTTLSFGN